MSLKNIAKHYFQSFEDMDLEEVSNMFADNVTLKDWNIYADGKVAVVAANKSIFDSVQKLEVNVVELYIYETTAIAELLIYADDADALPVVDIIKFDSDQKIKSIVAYRGN